MQQPILLLLVLVAASSSGGRPKCGGVYTAARGVLQTPGFPHSLPVPLHCEWVIDAQNFATPNASIVVYLTQLFVHEGLSFTEYQIYDRTYQLDGRTIHIVNETNVVQVRWVQSYQNFLLVKLDLESVASAHLRVLDGFLDVYGFNITYEVTRGGVRSDSCTMMDCGFTGTCYDHYTKFSCDCFAGYSGPHCSQGAKSFCRSQGATCKNGGTCIHVGVSAVKCHCLKEFTGETCQIPVAQKVAECEQCISTCRFDGRLENACKCKNSNSTNNTQDKAVFVCIMHLSNFPSLLSGDGLRTFIANQVYRSLKANYSRVDEIHVENIEYFRSGAEVSFHLFAPKKDEKRIRSILNRWADRGYIANLTVADKEFVFRPLDLDLQSVSVNQPGVIRQQDEFILSCVARGSPTMSFRWFKDGAFVNVSEATSHKWSRLIKDPHVDNQYTALLGFERAHTLDGGTFTCQVEDFGVQQCSSRKIQITSPPIIKVEPMSQTVKKGENFTIKCLSMGQSLSKITYSWTKNRELIPVRSPGEKYEILYPGGSILQVFKVDKSVKYSCLVQDESVSAEIQVRINVVNPHLVRTCPVDESLGTVWPETAPDTDSLIECPRGYVLPGHVSRTCTLSDGLNPVWRQPDYSGCTAEKLDEIETNFELLQLGYEATTPFRVLERCLEYVASRSDNSNDNSELEGMVLYPGEGARILLLLMDVISYTRRSRYVSSYNVTAVTFDVLDRILMHGNSLIDQEQVKLLQEVVGQQVDISSSLLTKTQPSLRLSLTTIDLNLMVVESNTKDFAFRPFRNNNKSAVSVARRISGSGFVDDWTPTRVRLDLNKSQKNYNRRATVLGVLVYRNLTAFLPSRSVIRLKDGAEVEYEVVSRVMRVWILPSDHQTIESSQVLVVVDWKRSLIDNNTLANNNNNVKEGWFLKCATAETAMYAYSWNTSVCSTMEINSTLTRCLCPRDGTFALLLTANNIQVEKEEPRPRRYVVLAGCSLCFLSALGCTIVLAAHWLLKRSCIVFLKLQCSVSITGVMLTFVLATIGDPPEGMFANVMAFLEMLLLMGMSAHVSTLLVVYTELIQLPRAASSKQTVIGISTGVPVIAVFGNHLAHRTMDVRLRSWWLIAGTLAFNIFLTVTTVILALFLLLYFTVISKLKKLSAIHEKDGKILKRRIVMLKKSACVFFSLIIATGSSIVYTNFPDDMWSHYEFCVSAMLLGLIIMVCYVIKSESEFYIFHGRLKSKQKDGFFGVEFTGSPLNFFTKEEAEVESESIPHHRNKSDQIMMSASKSVECFQMTDACKSGLPECVSSTMESYAASHEDAIYCEQRNNGENLERYNRSPQLFRKSSTFKIEEEMRNRSPDIIASKNCTELDLVASHAPSIIITPEESISQILNNPKTLVRSQPEGREIISTVSDKIAEVVEPPVTTLPENVDNLDGMLDRISHDLDYLLNNRSEVEVCTTPAPVANPGGTLRRISKPPSPSVIQEEAEDEVDDECKVPEAITDILRTSC